MIARLVADDPVLVAYFLKYALNAEKEQKQLKQDTIVKNTEA